MELLIQGDVDNRPSVPRKYSVLVEDFIARMILPLNACAY